jgi:TonB family protein
VKARVVVASAALHITAVVGLLVARTAAPGRPTVDIEIVPPAMTTEPAAPPRVEPAAAPGGNPVIAPVPHRGAPARAEHPRRNVSPSRPPAAPPTPEIDASAPAVPPPGDGSELGPPGDGAGFGGNGSGSGSGNGNADGNIELDRSARPLPLNATDVTLPYTEEAARRRVGGNVIVELSIDPLGDVRRATIARGLGYGLDEIAMRTALQLRFRPARDRAGRPTAATVRWRFHFDPP